MRAVIWAAVSSKPQADEDKDSIPTQISSAERFIESRGWDEVHAPLTVAHSRSYLWLHDLAQDVPEYEQLMTLARGGSFDLLVCRSRDRLARTDTCIVQLESYLRSCGVQILSLEMPTPVQDPAEFRKLRDRGAIWSSAVERARAEDELIQLKTRHAFGMKARTRKGLHPSLIPFGYRKGPDGIAEVYEPEAAIVRLMYRWLLVGDTFSDILRKLPNYATERYPKSIYMVKYTLENPFYAGLSVWSRLETRWRSKPRDEWVEAEGLHEPIIDRDTWEAAQRELERRLESKAPRTRYALTGLLYCGFCGGAMKGAKSRKGAYEYRYYVCARDGCVRNSYRADALESLMAEWIDSMVQSPEMLEREMQKAVAEADRLQAEELGQMQQVLEQKQAGLERWAADYELGLLSREEFYGHQARLKDEIGSLETAIARATREHREPERAAEMVRNVAQEADWTDWETAKRIRTQLASVGLRITVKDKKAVVSLSA